MIGRAGVWFASRHVNYPLNVMFLDCVMSGDVLFSDSRFTLVMMH